MEPVCIQIPLELLKQIRLALRECSEDLDAELKVRYGEGVTHPTEERRLRRDRGPVVDAQYCLGQLAEIIKD